MTRAGNPPNEFLGREIAPHVLFGNTEEMGRIHKTIERVAPIRVPVLIRGENGTGKEALAVYLHRVSSWNGNPFVKVNCAAIPGTLLESELFGYEKGAFTGAYNTRPGKFELAHGGTLLLDEIADIDGGLQAKLLHALQDGCFARIGGLEERRAEVRIISVTNRDIEQEIARGSFREDLYYRINVVNIQVPPLRQRLQDLPLLVDHFLRTYGEQYDRNVSALPAEIMDRFREHRWPGNIRELENYVRRYVILGSADGILAELRERSQVQVATGFHLTSPEDFSMKKFAKEATQKAERYLMLEALRETRWNRRRASRLLGISYRALLYKMREAGLPSKRNSGANGKENAKAPVEASKENAFLN